MAGPSTNVYVIANLYQELLSDTRINVAGLDFGSGNDRTWGGIGVGGHHSWGGGKYALYGEVSANTALGRYRQLQLEGQCGRQDPMVSDRRASGQELAEDLSQRSRSKGRLLGMAHDFLYLEQSHF